MSENSSSPDPSPHLRRPRQGGGEGFVLEHFREFLDQRLEAGFGHGRDQVVEHAALAEQGMGSAFGGVDLEMAVHAERFAGLAEQGEQQHGEGVEQKQAVAALGIADAHRGEPHAEAEILGVAEAGFDGLA